MNLHACVVLPTKPLARTCRNLVSTACRPGGSISNGRAASSLPSAEGLPNCHYFCQVYKFQCRKNSGVHRSTLVYKTDSDYVLMRTRLKQINPGTCFCNAMAQAITKNATKIALIYDALQGDLRKISPRIHGLYTITHNYTRKHTYTVTHTYTHTYAHLHTSTQTQFHTHTHTY